ncbi:hypothetical protein AYI70_g11062 [Smittium culicis]|uniref:Uncharacterized protein n=1 Tax=Smittium culicis TaxID=133412 RepID=A0A1R1X3H9_9FUNG|nr:hypothetical protein AYI70_g11062 [Smittium culicis]
MALELKRSLIYFGAFVIVALFVLLSYFLSKSSISRVQHLISQNEQVRAVPEEKKEKSNSLSKKELDIYKVSKLEELNSNNKPNTTYTSESIGNT